VRIGAVANLRPVKNVDGLIRAASILSKDFPHLQFEVAGDGEERSTLQAQIHAADLTKQFRLLGKVDPIPAFLSRIDIAVLCSHSESMSNALLEYMAAGRAIVATDVGSNATLVRNGCDGTIVPANDDLSVVAAIRGYLANPRLAREHGAAARSRVAANYSRNAMVRRFEAYFTNLAQLKGPRRSRGPKELLAILDS
jgi:glycosyltransferase involved in cell wall biosynthesis